MNVSEVFFMVLPVAWFSYERLWLKRSLMTSTQWSLLLGGCFILSFFLIRKLSMLLSGKWVYPEMFYYGWFLFSLFVVLQIMKKIVRAVIEKIIRWPKNPRIRQGTIKFIFYSIMFMVMIPFSLAMTSIHRIKVGDSFNPQWALGLKYEDVSLMTKDNLRINGWFLPAQSDKAVVIGHGLGANKSNFIGTADMWHQMGYNVLIFDFRGHGLSSGHTVSFGYKERFDVLAALDYLVTKKNFLPQNIWGYGVSFGGAAMIHAANEAKFHGLIIDSSFASLDDMAEKIIGGEAIIPVFCRKVIKELALFFVRVDLGFDIRQHSPENVVAQLQGIPILFIHGKGDPLINWQQTQRLYQRAKEPKEIVILNTSGHFGTPNDAHYIELIQNFILKTDKAYLLDIDSRRKE